LLGRRGEDNATQQYALPERAEHELQRAARKHPSPGVSGVVVGVVVRLVVWVVL